MNYYDEQLKQLQTQMATKNRLETVLKDLREQFKDLSAKVEDLESKRLKEQEDVNRLECRSLAAFFYNVVGKMDDKLTKEKQEAYEVSVKYDAAYKELKSVEEDIRFYESELGKVSDSEEQYKATMKAKLDAMKATGIPEVAEILKLEERISYLETQKKEIREAVSAGQSAERIVELILSNLSDAEGWGTWDMFGGGLIADVAKHSHLDEAQEQVEQLQVALRRFKTELADVAIESDLQVNIDGFLRFADYFFDGLFADWAVMERISESQSQVQKTQKQIEQVISKLSSMDSALEKEQDIAKAKLNEIIVNTTL